jgi:hypothetical protein
MVKTRLETVPEVLKHLELKIAEVERSLKSTQKNPNLELVAPEEYRLRGQLEVMKAFRAMIIC